MSLRYGYFDSEITGYDEEGMPIFDRAESSDFLALFISSIISDGVLASPGDCFQVVAGEGMNLKVRPGFGIIKGRFAYDENEFRITIPAASVTNKRIDRVILRANYLLRKCEIIIRQGVVASNPVPPELIRPEAGDYYELCLATVQVNARQTVITQSSITDTRLDSKVCGLVTQVIDHLDTSVFYAQLNQFYTEYVNKANTSYEEFRTRVESWFTTLKQEKTSQLNQLLADFEKMMETSQTEFEDWFTGNTNNWEEEWTTWFNNLKEQLTDNAVTNLQSQIGILKNLKTTAKDSLVAAVNEVKDSSGVTGVKGNNESAYRKGNVNLTPANIGALPDSTVPVNKGGTGQTTAVNAANALINALPAGSGTAFPVDNNFFVSQETGGAATYYRRPFSVLWGYIKKKIDAATDIKAYQAVRDGEGDEIRGTYLRMCYGLRICTNGTFSNDTIELWMQLNHSYLLVTKEITKSTGKIYGFRARMYTTPDLVLTDADWTSNNMVKAAKMPAAPSAANLCASTNAGVTLGTINTAKGKGYYDVVYGITLKANSTYEVQYELYDLQPNRFGLSIINFDSQTGDFQPVYAGMYWNP